MIAGQRTPREGERTADGGGSNIKARPWGTGPGKGANNVRRMKPKMVGEGGYHGTSPSVRGEMANRNQGG